VKSPHDVRFGVTEFTEGIPLHDSQFALSYNPADWTPRLVPWHLQPFIVADDFNGDWQPVIGQPEIVRVNPASTHPWMVRPLHDSLGIYRLEHPAVYALVHTSDRVRADPDLDENMLFFIQHAKRPTMHAYLYDRHVVLITSDMFTLVEERAYEQDNFYHTMRSEFALPQLAAYRCMNEEPLDRATEKRIARTYTLNAAALHVEALLDERGLTMTAYNDNSFRRQTGILQPDSPWRRFWHSVEVNTFNAFGWRVLIPSDRHIHRATLEYSITRLCKSVYENADHFNLWTSSNLFISPPTASGYVELRDLLRDLFMTFSVEKAALSQDPQASTFDLFKTPQLLIVNQYTRIDKTAREEAYTRPVYHNLPSANAVVFVVLLGSVHMSVPSCSQGSGVPIGQGQAILLPGNMYTTITPRKLENEFFKGDDYDPITLTVVY